MTALRAVAALGLAVLAAGCGSRGGDLPGDAAIAGAPDCGKKPAFVPLQADAKVLVCSVDHMTRRDSGTIIYTSAAAPTAVLGASKDQAHKAGLAEQLSTPETFSASEGDQRSVMVMAAAQGAGSQVTVTWSRAR